MLYSKEVRSGSVSARRERKMHKVLGAVLACSLTAGVFAQGGVIKFRPYRIADGTPNYLAFGGSTVLLRANEIWTKQTGRKVIAGGVFDQVSPLGSVLGRVNNKPAMVTPAGEVVMLPESAPDGTILGRALYQRRDGTILGLSANRSKLFWIAPDGSMTLQTLPSPQDWGRTWAGPDGRIASVVRTQLLGLTLRTLDLSGSFRSIGFIEPIRFGTEDMRFRFLSKMLNWDGTVENVSNDLAWNNVGGALTTHLDSDRSGPWRNISVKVYSPQTGDVYISRNAAGLIPTLGHELSDNGSSIVVGTDPRNLGEGYYLVEPVPEPGSFAALIAGLVGLWRRKVTLRKVASRASVLGSLAMLGAGAMATPRFVPAGFTLNIGRPWYLGQYGALAENGNVTVGLHQQADYPTWEHAYSYFWKPGDAQPSLVSGGRPIALTVNSSGLIGGKLHTTPIYNVEYIGALWTSPRDFVNPHHWIRWSTWLHEVTLVTDSGWIAGIQAEVIRPLLISPTRQVHYFDHRPAGSYYSYRPMFLNEGGSYIYTTQEFPGMPFDYFLWSPTSGEVSLGKRFVGDLNNRNEIIFIEKAPEGSNLGWKVRLVYRSPQGIERILKSTNASPYAGVAKFTDNGDLYLWWEGQPAILNLDGTMHKGPFSIEPPGPGGDYRIEHFFAANNSGQVLASVTNGGLGDSYILNLNVVKNRDTRKGTPGTGKPMKIRP